MGVGDSELHTPLMHKGPAPPPTPASAMSGSKSPALRGTQRVSFPSMLTIVPPSPPTQHGQRSEADWLPSLSPPPSSQSPPPLAPLTQSSEFVESLGLAPETSREVESSESAPLPAWQMPQRWGDLASKVTPEVIEKNYRPEERHQDIMWTDDAYLAAAAESFIDGEYYCL